MLGWVRAFENNSMNVSFAQVRRIGARAKTYLFGDHYKLTAWHSTSTSWLAKGCRVANDQQYILCSAIISTLPKTEKAYSLCMLRHPGTRIAWQGLAPWVTWNLQQVHANTEHPVRHYS